MTLCSFTIGLFSIEFGSGFDTFKLFPNWNDKLDESNRFVSCVNTMGFSAVSEDPVVDLVGVCDIGNALVPLIK